MREYHNIDCMDPEKGLPSFQDKHFKIAIADPNYGIGEHGGKNRSMWVKQRNGGRLYVEGRYEKKDWDNEACDPRILDEIIRVSEHQVIWGVNHYDWNPPGSGRIVWDKVNDGSDQSDCEIAYCSFHDTVRIFRFMWRGFCQGQSISNGTVQRGDKSRNQKRIHPTEKPFELYQWLLQTYAKLGDSILDPFVGSGSSLCVFEEMGFDYAAYEIDPGYYRDSTARLEAKRREPKLFTGAEIFEASKPLSLF